MRGSGYQIALIGLGCVGAILLGLFFYREIYPEYLIYQNDYIALEEFRSGYTGKPPPEFEKGIKQIVIETNEAGKPIVDRCTSCHVATQLPHFSPTKIKENADGRKEIIPNDDYVWAKLDATIQQLRDPEVIKRLKSEGKQAEVNVRLNQAATYEGLKTAKVGDYVYDVTKVLSMHPLIGKETRPFEFHPLDEYGCTLCHNGNGNGLVTDRAHGPVYDHFYETEYQGKFPKFTEPDPLNDPPFAKMFNYKPGARLIFQTQPIMIGSLTQAKCVECHAPTPIGDLASASELKNKFSEMDILLAGYSQGRQLFITQGCYACHKIAGFSRGGVGPELTKSNTIYPWYMKEKLMWPQFDLATSTMPEMKLDQTIIHDLMTFLLGQKGQNNAISITDYQKFVQAWESGKKLPFEEPLPAAKIHDLSYSMSVFATEGCASCHRLKGFESDVGFQIEKEKPSYEALYREKQWFKNLFPEEIFGSTIVEVIEKHAKEIDQKIAPDVRHGSLLEEIEKNAPGTIASFYSNFEYAMRAKNEQLKNSKKELDLWKERVRQLLLIYVQEYGLGRLICPRPNWSGIYRTDEWLMEHFKAPTAHTPNSIMPVFPFDDTKFYALTYMLDVLGKKNRNEVHEIWNHFGFNPEIAFQIHCSQCHGPYLQGNGPVAQWIYPIPKNLSNSDFLRNLTKERVMYAIHHGVKGTPMPPWGEAAVDKPTADGIPELTEEQIKVMADWLFSSLPGGSFQNQIEVPKWQYSAEDVIQDLKNEGNQLQKSSHELSYLPNGGSFLAALIPIANGKEQTVQDIFNSVPAPSGSPDKDHYFIKRDYYTSQNIAAGKAFFDLNCATCHGKEADGASIRAEAMQEAKPRMLINLDWLNTQDDLYLLRTIKYGVPGTAMTPWGDQTSSLQRLQLVIYIHSLSEEEEMRKRLFSALYQTFDAAVWQLERQRIEASKVRSNLESELTKTAAQKQILEDDVKAGKKDATIAVQMFEQELKLDEQLKKVVQADQAYENLEELLLKQKDLYKVMGVSLIIQKADPSYMDDLIQVIQLHQDLLKKEPDIGKINAAKIKFISEINKEIDRLEKEKVILSGKIYSSEVKEQLNQNTSSIEAWEKLKTLIEINFQKIADLQKEFHKQMLQLNAKKTT